MKFGLAPIRAFRIGGVAAISVSAIGLSAYAQTTSNDPNPSRLRLSTGIETNDDENVGFVGFDLRVDRETRSQTFLFDLSGRKEFNLGDFDGTDGFQPRARLSYTQESGPLDLAFNARYSQTEIDTLNAADLSDPGVTTADFVVDNGERIEAAADASFTYGARAPFGATLAFGVADLRFEGVSDERLIDRQTRSGQLGLRFNINPTLTARASYRLETTDWGDVQNTFDRTQRLSVGAEAQATRVMTVGANVTWTEIDREIDNTDGDRVAGTSDDLAYDVSMAIAQRNGTHRFSYQREIDPAGTSDRLRYQREFEVSDVQRLSYGAGFTRLNDGDAQLNANIDYAQELRNGRIRLAASQTSGFTSTDTPSITRQATADYQTAMTPNLAVGADMRLAAIDYTDDSFEDSNSVSVGVRLVQSLNRDWDVTARAYHTRVDNGSGIGKDTGLSLTISRSFSLFD